MLSYPASNKKPLKLSWLLLLEGILLLTGLGALYWQPSFTDGLRWVSVDSCQYALVDKLPFQQVRPFEVGDKLVRIDYMPACHLTLPPKEAETSLYLYEIIRQGEKHLLFAEFRPYPPLGWFQNPNSLTLHVVLFLTFSTMGIVLLRAMVTLRHYTDVSVRPVIALMWFFLFYVVLTGWVYDIYYREVSDWVGVVVGVLGLGWSLWRVEVGVGVAILAGIVAGLWPSHADMVAGIVLGGWGFRLRGGTKWLYWGLWLFWAYTYEPVVFLALAGLIVWDSLYAFLRNAYKILTLRERYFYLLGFLVASACAVGIGYPISELRGGNLILGALGGGVIGWISLESFYWLYRWRRRQRRGLLERELPLLWEVPDTNSLEHRIKEILKAHWDIGWAKIVEATGKQRLWLRRSGEPPLHPDWPQEEIEMAIPLGEPYWLLIGQARVPFTVEDIAWLVHFSRYVGISRRHLALYEAAHEARLQALRHQLSPHFLFNALHTLQGLLYEDVALAEKLLTGLGQLLRRSLELAKHLLIPLSEEIALVQDYLEIEKQRYGQRLIIQWEVGEPPTEILIPPFTIQTLVENAIKHAVAKQMRPTTIRLQVSYQEEKIQISVEDNGPGFSETNPAHGIGLSNLRTRLAHIYGTEAQLTIQGASGKGVKVEVTLPLAPPNRRTIPPDRNQSPGEAPS